MNIKKPTSIQKEEKNESLFLLTSLRSKYKLHNIQFRFHAYIIIHRPENEREKKRKSCFCVWVFSVALNHTFFHKYFVSLYFKRLLGRKHQLSNWSRSRIILTIFKKKKIIKVRANWFLQYACVVNLKKWKKTHTKQNNTVTDRK